jgi:hypothetical protein
MYHYQLALGLVTEAIEAHAVGLSALDAAGGDGDHRMCRTPVARGAIDAQVSFEGGDFSAVLDVVGKSLTSCEADPRAGSTPAKGAVRIPLDRNDVRGPFSSRRCNPTSQVVSR